MVRLRIIIISVIVTLVLGNTIYRFSHRTRDFGKCDYPMLKATFSNHIVVKKYIEDSSYYLILLNPITDTKYRVSVNDYVYFKLYFVTDTIK